MKNKKDNSWLEVLNESRLFHHNSKEIAGFWSPPFPFLFSTYAIYEWTLIGFPFCFVVWSKQKLPLISMVVKQWKKGKKKSSLPRQEWKTISEFLTVTILCNVSSMMIISEKNHRQLHVCEQNCSTLAMKTD